MGANQSSPSPAQVWKASGPNSVSQDVLDSLQSTHETDASRARLIELQVQARVAEELQKLQKQESKAFQAAREKLASAAPDAAGEKPTTTSHIVSKEVQDLRRRLEERKQVRQLPEAVEGARSDVIRCLTENDRRPLDCWQEVEKFKAEVKKLENSWVDKVVS